MNHEDAATLPQYNHQCPIQRFLVAVYFEPAWWFSPLAAVLGNKLPTCQATRGKTCL